VALALLEDNYKKFPSKIKCNEQQIVLFINQYSGVIAEETDINPNNYIKEGDIVELNTTPPVIAIVQKIQYFNSSPNKKYLIQFKILAEVELKNFKPQGE
jgi:hypothetical protein